MYIDPVRDSEFNFLHRAYASNLENAETEISVNEPKPPSESEIHLEEIYYQDALQLEEPFNEPVEHEKAMREFQKTLDQSPTDIFKNHESWRKRLGDKFWIAFLVNHVISDGSSIASIPRIPEDLMPDSIEYLLSYLDIFITYSKLIPKEMHKEFIEKISELSLHEIRFSELIDRIVDYLRITSPYQQELEAKILENLDKNWGAERLKSIPLENGAVNNENEIGKPKENLQDIEYNLQAIHRYIESIKDSEKNIDEFIDLKMEGLEYVYIRPAMEMKVSYIPIAMHYMVHRIISKNVSLFEKCMENLTAVVTHPSASLPEHMEKIPGLEVLKLHTYHPMDYFVHMYDKLAREGYKNIITILPDKSLWMAYFYASLAAKREWQTIHVIDATHFGLGLGLVTASLMKDIIYKVESINFEKKVKALKQSVNHWVIPFHRHRVYGHYWYQEILKTYNKSNESDEDTGVPLLSLGKKPGILSKHHDIENAIQKLHQRLDIEYKKRPFKLAIIEHYQGNKEAGELIAWFSKYYPNVTVHRRIANSFLQKTYGPHIACATM